MDEHTRAETERKRADNEHEFRDELKRWIEDELDYVWHTDDEVSVLVRMKKKIADLEKDMGLV